MSARLELVRHVAARIDSIRLGHPTRVAVDGVDASGKTTLADELAVELRRLGRVIVRASIDGFHNPASIRRRRGADSPEGYFHDSFDHAALRAVLLDPLGPGGYMRFRRAVFDFRTDAPIDTDPEEAAQDTVLLFDGVFLLRDELRDCWDYSIFVEASFSTTVKRAMRRDLELFGSPEEVERRYATRYVPGQEIYLSTVDPAAVASIVIDNDDPAMPVVRGPRI